MSDSRQGAGAAGGTDPDAVPAARDGAERAVRCDLTGPVAVVELDVPGRPVNVLTVEVLGALRDAFAAAAQEPRVRAIVLRSGKAAGFCAGADVSAISKVRDRARGAALAALGQGIYREIERCPKPVVTAVHGACLGGGLELALATSAIVAAEDDATRLGLPEVRLGIVPGFGGTQRLPRRVGLPAAADLIVSGRSLSARRARRAGLVDRLAPPWRLSAVAEELALELAAAPRGRPPGRPSWLKRLLGRGPLRRLVLGRVRKVVLARTHGLYPAPLKALDLVERAYHADREAGYRAEAEAVGELLAGAESHALVDLFLGMEELKRQGGAEAGFAAGDQVAVVGAGVMGSAIARRFLECGAAVRLIDRDVAAVQGGLARIARDLERAAREGRLREVERRRLLDRLEPAVGVNGVGRCVLAVEAVVERLDVKRDVMRALARGLPAGAALYTNTSSLPLAEIAAVDGSRLELVGLHFFNPVDRMPLIEVVVPEGTAPVAVERALAVARRLGKVPVRVKDAPGFLVNRILAPYLAEALALLDEGVAAERIDRVMERLGFAMGPLRVLDTVGLDVAVAVAESLKPHLGGRMAETSIGRRLVDAGRLGAKSSGGIYDARGRPGRWLANLRAAPPRQAPEGPHGVDAEIADRLHLVLVAEAARALAADVVAGPRPLDLALVLGAGYPAARGGPLAELARRGAANVAARLAELAGQFGPRFAPGPELASAAERSRIAGVFG